MSETASLYEGVLMNAVRNHLKTLHSFCLCESGATAIEYALIAGFVSIAILGGIQSLGGGMSSMFNAIMTAIN